ncbi:lithostathine-1-like [Elgaria multicarinata webbii]|uniref:lithostathine-1-like n=1 Tax=Elgaria multicarinata webbii TaxID=159646 RepID=UPI002FCD4A66
MATIAYLVFCLFGLLSTTWAKGLKPRNPALPRTTCPDGTLSYNFNFEVYCFEFFSNPLTFAEAEAACQRSGKDGHLASVTSAIQTDLIGTYVSESNWRGQYVWIGLTLKPNSNPVSGWRWTDGTRFMYNSWAAGEPNDYAHQFNCAVLTPYLGNRLWVDASCNSKNAFLCKWKPS